MAAALVVYLEGKSPAGPVWGGTWARDKRGAEMIRIDLDAAGIPYAVEGPDGPEYADFHALRHSYLTLGGRSGIDLRTLQELAGHSKPELTARYSHRRLHDLTGAVAKIPNIIPVPDHPKAGETGTGGGPVCTPFARTPCRPGQQVTPPGNAPGVAAPARETTQPPVSQGFGPQVSPRDTLCLERGRRDSNPQPPDRQSGTLTN